MKYNDNGEWKDIIVKATDTLPIGTEVDYNGTDVPDGWEEVSSISNIQATSIHDNIKKLEVTGYYNTYTKIAMINFAFGPKGGTTIDAYNAIFTIKGSNSNEIELVDYWFGAATIDSMRQTVPIFFSPNGTLYIREQITAEDWLRGTATFMIK